MADMRVGGIGGVITAVTQTGKSIALKEGEIVRGVVVDTDVAGGATVSIKGVLLAAKTDLFLEPGKALLFQITTEPTGDEVKLHVLGSADAEETELPKGAAPRTTSGEDATRLIRDFSAKLRANPADVNLDSLEKLIKELPDSGKLPPAAKAELVEVLRQALQSSGEDIRTRGERLVNFIRNSVGILPGMEEVEKNIRVGMEELLKTPLGTILRDTGVTLEAKLKSLARVLAADGDQPLLPEKIVKGDVATGAGAKGVSDTAGASAMNLKDLVQALTAEEDQALLAERSLKEPVVADPNATKVALRAKARGDRGIEQLSHSVASDLKGQLLRLKEILEDREAGRSGPADQLSRRDQGVLLEQTDRLLKDIEMFQLLSRTTDSFYTFLPLDWAGLKGGEAAFRKNESDHGEESFSCSVNLDLEEQGKLNIIVLKLGQKFFATFKSSDLELRDRFSANQDELKSACAAAGITLEGVRVLDLTDPFMEKLERLEKFDGLINTKA